MSEVVKLPRVRMALMLHAFAGRLHTSCRGLISVSPMAEIRQLRYFAAVAEHGSVSRAAVELHLSQSALSEALRKLEVELGAELLHRTSRGVRPTAAGEALLPEARRAVAAFETALQ